MAERSTGRIILLVLAGWLAAAALAGAGGLWLRLPAPFLGALLWLLVAALLLAWRWTRLGPWLREVDPRALVLLHVTRLVGLEFLALFQRGRLPFAFATPGGYGDILAAAGALVVALLCVPVRSRPRRAVLLLWNTFGLLDLLLVVGTAMRFFITRPSEMAPLRELPLCLLPSFLVPILIVSHLVLYARFGPSRGGTAPGKP